MSAYTDIQAGIGEAFNALKTEFFDTTPKVTLLKQSSTTRLFEDVEAVITNWWLEYPTEFRKTFLLRIAEGVYLKEYITEATHVQVGDDVYVISKGDTVEPKGSSVMWQLFCDRFTERGQFSNLY